MSGSEQTLLALMNQSGLLGSSSELKKALVAGALAQLHSHSSGQEDPKQAVRSLLNSLGPAEATSAVDYAIRAQVSKGLFDGSQFNGSLTHNVRMAENYDGDPFSGYQTSLREFLLPRTAYHDADLLLDPKHRIDRECGFPTWITPAMFKLMYERDDVSNRVVDIYPDETWAVEPLIYETEDETEDTPFEIELADICRKHKLFQFLYRIDKLSGVGHYGVLLMGLDDGQLLDVPVDEPELLAGQMNTVAKQRRKILYLRPFDEYLSFVEQYEPNPNSPRYGLPLFYNLVFSDLSVGPVGYTGTRTLTRVHWTRVIHVADNLRSSLVFGVPRMQPSFNRLLSLRTIKGSSGEMFYHGAFPGLSFEINPDLVQDDPQIDRKALREEIARYADGLQRYLALVGVSAKSLAIQCEDPGPHVKVHEEAIATQQGVPFRIWKGSEEARLASSEDKLTWNRRLARRQKMSVEPNLIQPIIDRFIAIGVLPNPKEGKYYTGWNDLNTTTDEDRANLALKNSQALSQYVASGLIHLIPPMEYLTLILGMRVEDAKRIVDEMNAQGGLAKLQKVDPSQGAGVNGKRQDQTGDTSNKGEPQKRNAADKKTEGSSS